VTRRRRGEVSWHAAAHALVALARLTPAAVAPALREFAGHDSEHLRRYAARAAAALADTATLRRLVRDTDPNVAEAAIDGLSRLSGQADDTLFIAVLESPHAQVVRAAAVALADSASTGAHDLRASARRAAEAALARWPAARSDSERDVRLALLAAAGRPHPSEQPSRREADLAPGAVTIALGAEVRLRVTLADASGGGSFVVRLRGDAAPITAARVLDLARSGYYDGTTWHRVEPDFVIQGGSHGDNEYVGYDRYFRDELGTVPHVRGTVGMSTRGHDTGDAQWFVNLRDNLRLATAYTVFAEVVEGMDVVDGILEGDVIESVSEVTQR
jgi:cyclophilin family peptidyl-prolyl cis-trans isomerase